MKNKQNHTRSALSLVMVFFLIVSIFSGPLSAFGLFGIKAGVSISKKTDTTSSSDSEQPYEEKEGEVKDVSEEFHDICITDSSSNQVLAALACSTIYTKTHLPYPFLLGHVPLYISKRSLLI